MSKSMKASLLVRDYNLYPRHQMDESNVKHLSDALDAGETLPPVIADKATLKIVDGFHRTEAVLRKDEEASIAVTLVEYENEAAMFIDAVARNSRHGVGIQAYDRARCVEIAHQLHVDDDALAGALAVNQAVLGRLRAKKLALDPKGNMTPIKRPLRHLAGQKLTSKQMTANDKSSGWSVRFHAEQIVLAIEGDIVEWDESTREALLRLQEVLAAQFAAA